MRRNKKLISITRATLLPDLCFDLIMKFLPLKDIYSVMLTCKALYQVSLYSHEYLEAITAFENTFTNQINDPIALHQLQQHLCALEYMNKETWVWKYKSNIDLRYCPNNYVKYDKNLKYCYYRIGFTNENVIQCYLNVKNDYNNSCQVTMQCISEKWIETVSDLLKETKDDIRSKQIVVYSNTDGVTADILNALIIYLDVTCFFKDHTYLLEELFTISLFDAAVNKNVKLHKLIPLNIVIDEQLATKYNEFASNYLSSRKSFLHAIYNVLIDRIETKTSSLIDRQTTIYSWGSNLWNNQIVNRLCSLMAKVSHISGHCNLTKNPDGTYLRSRFRINGNSIQPIALTFRLNVQSSKTEQLDLDISTANVANYFSQKPTKRYLSIHKKSSFALRLIRKQLFYPPQEIDNGISDKGVFQFLIWIGYLVVTRVFSNSDHVLTEPHIAHTPLHL
jgi:hypothetical protein